MLHWWLLPALAVIAVVIATFFIAMKYRGGTGVRSEGRTMVDKPVDDDSP